MFYDGPTNQMGARLSRTFLSSDRSISMVSVMFGMRPQMLERSWPSVVTPSTLSTRLVPTFFTRSRMATGA